MKILRIIAWASAALAGIIVVIAVIALLSDKTLFGLNHVVNYFHTANTFLLIAIALFIATKK